MGIRGEHRVLFLKHPVGWSEYITLCNSVLIQLPRNRWEEQRKEIVFILPLQKRSINYTNMAGNIFANKQCLWATSRKVLVCSYWLVMTPLVELRLPSAIQCNWLKLGKQTTPSPIGICEKNYFFIFSVCLPLYDKVSLTTYLW